MSLEWSTLDNCFNSPLTESDVSVQAGGDTSKPWLNFNEHQSSYRDDVFSPFFENSNESNNIPTSKDELIPQPSQVNIPVGSGPNNAGSPTIPPNNESRSSSMDILKALDLNNTNQSKQDASLQNNILDGKKNQYNQYDPPVKTLFPIPEGEKKKSTNIRDVIGNNSTTIKNGERPISTRAMFPNHKNNNYNIHVDKASKKVVPNTYSSIPKFGMNRAGATHPIAKPVSDTTHSVNSNLIEGFKESLPADFVQSDYTDNQNKIWMVVLGIYISIMALIVGNNLRR